MEEGTMTDLRITTTSGTDTVLDEATIQGFMTGMRGSLLRPGDAGYDEARTVWNGMIDRRPALIAHCAGAADVIQAVHFARTHHLLVSVRGGGHNVTGTAVCDGGLMIDLSRMRSVRVDPGRRTVRAEGGTKWVDFDHETQAFGLATTGGTCSDTGIAGLTLGGGIGWLGGKYGLASDNLVSVDIVTADGQFLTASATEHADLFWGVRGGGGNFGVVTSFEYQLYPVGPLVLGGMVLHPFEQAKAVLNFYSEFSSNIPDELTTACGFLTSEGRPVVAIVACYNGSLEAGEEALRPIREFGPPLEDHLGPMPYTQVQQMFDEAWGIGRQYYVKAPWVQSISSDAIDTLVAHFAHVTSPLSLAVFFQKSGAMRRGPYDQTAFGHREARYALLITSMWLDPKESERHIHWAHELSEAFEPFTSGGEYINDLGREAEEGMTRIKAGYGANYERLVALKTKYDPSNLFRHNQNIQPTG
jgi:FAD/FMN-containing dehydrogenase